MRRGAERRAYSKNIPNNVQFRTAQPISGPRQQTPEPGAGGLGSLVRNTSEDRAKDRTNNARHVALVPAACAMDRCPFPQYQDGPVNCLQRPRCHRAHSGGV